MSLENPKQTPNDSGSDEEKLPDGWSEEQKESYRKTEEARKRFHEFGKWGVTANDHELIGGTPPGELTDNPGKTMGEIMTDKEIEDGLDTMIKYLKMNEEKYEKDRFNYMAKSGVEYYTEQIPLALKYLESLGRLPERYKEYNL